MSDPEEAFHHNRARAESFGAVADQYDRFRPEHAVGLIQELAAAGPAAALDVACGTGKVAAALAAQEIAVLGVEVDARMAELARDRGIAVEVAPFEDWDDAGRRFDLLTVGSAWHWIDPERGAAKAALVLNPGGTFARFWSYHVLAAPLLAELAAVYQRVAPSVHVHGQRPSDPALDDPSLPPDPVATSDAFDEVVARTWEAPQAMTTDGWIGLCSTFSDNQRLPAEQREELFGGLRTVLDTHGGTVPTQRCTLALICRRV